MMRRSSGLEAHEAGHILRLDLDRCLLPQGDEWNLLKFLFQLSRSLQKYQSQRRRKNLVLCLPLMVRKGLSQSLPMMMRWSFFRCRVRRATVQRPRTCVQWRVYQSAPHHAAKLNLIASKDSSIVEQVNKLVREVYASRSVSVQVQSLRANKPDQLCLVAWSDASLANRPDLSSTGSYMVGLTNQQALEAGIGKVNPVAWKSGKLHRVARSSLSAESQALADAEQELFYARLAWWEMQGRTPRLPP